MEGIFCAHIFKVLNRLDIVTIPDIYILPRWTREARSLVTPVLDLGAEDAAQWASRVTSLFLRASYTAATSMEARTIVTDCCTEMLNKIHSLSLNESGNQVHAESFGDVLDVGEGLAKRSGKRKAKRYKPQVELRVGRNRRRKVMSLY